MKGTNREVVKAYFRGIGPNTNSTGSLYWANGVLYSYGEHFPLVIKRVINGNMVLYVNSDKYSVTTSCHQGLVRRELNPDRERIISADTGEMKELLKNMAA